MRDGNASLLTYAFSKIPHNYATIEEKCQEILCLGTVCAETVPKTLFLQVRYVNTCIGIKLIPNNLIYIKDITAF